MSFNDFGEEQTSPFPGTLRRSDCGDSEVFQLSQVDKEFQQLGCLGHGSFGSVFLAKKRSGRLVALKVMRFELDGDVEEERQKYNRELDAVLHLDDSTDDENGKNRDLSIVFFEDWFSGPGFGCFVMSHADGGTLAQEVESMSSGQGPYSERRIAWYALQLSSALAHAHQRGIAHHDVKSSNVLVDRSAGGKLLLADFGSAIAPGEESVGFSEIYASPELQDAHAREDYTGLDGDKIDSFGLGCILFELLCCKKLVEHSIEQTLAEFIQEKGSVDAALDLPCIRLPWIPSDSEPTKRTVVGYSSAMRNLVKNLLEPLPSNRWTPSELELPLQQDPRSPLLTPYVVAARTPTPGVPVTIDNIQLGMFVQRGLDWENSDSDDFAPGVVGVVVKLDPDGIYTEVAFPPSTLQPSDVPKPICCRIGARNKYELQVGPSGFVGSQTIMDYGAFYVENARSEGYIGQLVNGNFMVVSLHEKHQDLLLAAPLERRVIASLPAEEQQPLQIGNVQPRKPLPPPEKWDLDMGFFPEVDDTEEWEMVKNTFHSSQGGLDVGSNPILSIKRVQSKEIWERYTVMRESVAEENWGVVNERRLFYGTGTFSPMPEHCSIARKYEEMFTTPHGFCAFESAAQAHFVSNQGFCENVRQMLLVRAALGRVDERSIGQADTPHYPLRYHSVSKFGLLGKSYSVKSSFQLFPEYVITYQGSQSPERISNRRIVRARNPACEQDRSLRRGIELSQQRQLHDRQPIVTRQRVHRSRLNATTGSSVLQDLPLPTIRQAGIATEEGRNDRRNNSASSHQNRASVVGVRRLSRQSQITSSSNRRQPNQHTRNGGREPSSVQDDSRPSRRTELSRLSDRFRSDAVLQRGRHTRSIEQPRDSGSVGSGNATKPASSSKQKDNGDVSLTESPSSSTKMCVICWENPVSHILIPCGHPCLCENCSAPRKLKKLRQKCPECRTKFRDAFKFYGKVVES